MHRLTLIFIAVGLAMDAFAVSISCGLAFRRREHTGAIRIAFFFGLFQAGMPILGWLSGLALRSMIETVDHWIAFALLGLVGGHMIWEAMARKSQGQLAPPTFPALLALSVATSIDALAVGLSLSVLRVRIITPAVIIGLVTFVLSFLGIVLGHESKHLFSFREQRAIQALGGAILIAIGLKILLGHILS